MTAVFRVAIETSDLTIVGMDIGGDTDIGSIAGAMTGLTEPGSSRREVGKPDHRCHGENRHTDSYKHPYRPG
jgi:hypothetical protein